MNRFWRALAWGVALGLGMAWIRRRTNASRGWAGQLWRTTVRFTPSAVRWVRQGTRTWGRLRRRIG